MKSFPAFGILLRSRSQRPALFSLLESNSGLPGQEANLDLARSFAAAAASMRMDEGMWKLLLEMSAVTPAEAPADSPREFIPFCSLLALGALLGEGLPRQRRRASLAAIRRAAADPRWRVRDAAAMSLQLLGERDADALRAVVKDWLPSSSPLEKRAIAAGLAHPPLLADPDFALFCLDTAAAILAGVSRADAKARKAGDFRALRQGLGPAVSLFVAARPAEGFALLRKSAAVRDPDIRRIVKDAIANARLAGPFPGQVRQVALTAGEGAGR